MSKSILDERFQQGDRIVEQISSEQFERLKRVGDLWRSQLADWEDLSKAEDSVRREYTGRYLFELLQNANDAILDWYETNNLLPWEKPSTVSNRVRLNLSSKSLMVSNDGLPFSEDNIRALCRLGQTTKKASKQIGHKGIGFKSVLEITDQPEVYSDLFAFGYDRQEFTSQVKRIIRGEISQSNLPILRAPFKRRISWLPSEDRCVIDEIFDQEFTTIIRLPLNLEKLVEDVQKRLVKDITPQLLLFLDAIDQLEVYLPDGRNYSFWRKVIRGDNDSSFDVILLSDQSGEGQIISRWLVLEPEEVYINDRSLVSGLGEAWEDVHSVRHSVAFPITKDGSDLLHESVSQPFFVYFPTEEYSGLKFLVNGDFYLESARKDIRRCALNDHLAEEMALSIASKGLDVLKKRFPKNPSIVDILAPASDRPQRDFARFFFDQYLMSLSSCEFVPLPSSHYKTPSDVRFPPLGASSTQFRKFFPANRMCDEQKWAYPLEEVEEREVNRKHAGHPFLVNTVLGAQYLTINDIVNALANGPDWVEVKDYGAFFRFIAHWWNNINASRRQELVHAISQLPIIPTKSGWKIPSTSLIFQANLREEETLNIPDGFDFEVVPIDIYGEERSYDGIPAKFLAELKVSPFVARDILRRAILPVLRNQQRFNALLSSNPNSIFEAYCFLKEYFERERSTSEFEDILSEIPVPAFKVDKPDARVWAVARNVYFANYWIGNDDLETIYEGIEEILFLGKVDEITVLEDAEEKQRWYNFFHRLGVSYCPKIIEHDSSERLRKYYGDNQRAKVLKREHAFIGCAFWNSYMEKYWEKFVCDNPLKDHGYSRDMRKNWQLEYFEEIASKKDIDKSIRLFNLLGRNWKQYQEYLRIKLECSYTSIGCPTVTIPSYFGYCLKEIEWLPAEILGKTPDRLFRANDIWNLGEDVRPEVRRLVPSLPEIFLKEEYRSIRTDLLRSKYSFDDYLSLLQKLPDFYPLHKDGIHEGDQRKWNDAIRAVFNWICQALQNILARVGDENWPSLPKDLKVMAYKGNKPEFVSVNSQNLVYPDDPFTASIWEDDLWFIKLDDSWGSLRAWLKIRDLSKHIDTTLAPWNEVQDMTQVATKTFQSTFPYFLAIVYKNQNSRFDRILVRLLRLGIHVVDNLALSQSYIASSLEPKVINQPAYLIQRDEKNPTTGFSYRAGDLYISKDAVDNPYVLGNHVANYVEIERLSDAFTILYNNYDDQIERLRFLESKGVKRETIDVVMDEIKRRHNNDLGEDSKDLHWFFQEDAPFIDGKEIEFGKTQVPSDHSEGGSVVKHTDGDSSNIGTNESFGREIKPREKNGSSTSKLDQWRPRLRSYVERSDDSKDKGQSEGIKKERDEIEQVGIDVVKAYEQRFGRYPYVLPPNHEGWDINVFAHQVNDEIGLSGIGAIRRIEVKATKYSWDGWGVGLTAPEFRQARKFGDNYYLYVVEYALDPARISKPYVICNPASLITEYRFDDDWKKISVKSEIQELLEK